ncbi:hypothetical protein ACEQUB_03423 [Ralstonia syzygii]
MADSGAPVCGYSTAVSCISSQDRPDIGPSARPSATLCRIDRPENGPSAAVPASLATKRASTSTTAATPPIIQSDARSGRPSDTIITTTRMLPALPKCVGHTRGWASWCLNTTPASSSVSGTDSLSSLVSASANSTRPTSTRKA